MMQQNNDPKNSSYTVLYNQMAQKDKNQCAETVQSPVLNETEMLQQDFKQANN